VHLQRRRIIIPENHDATLVKKALEQIKPIDYHQNRKQFRCKICGCGPGFTTKYSTMQHVVDKHPGRLAPGENPRERVHFERILQQPS
jgi:hypothetical protein